MKIALIILSVIVLYFVADLGIFWYRINHLPNLVSPDQSDKILGSGPNLRYIAAGDSTAAGIGATTLQNTYTYKIAEYLSEKNTVAYRNIGVKGYKTGDVLKDQISQIIAYKPDIVTISIGANDATHLESNKTILENYKSIINQIQTNTSAKIYICDIPNFKIGKLLPWFYIAVLEQKSNTLNPEILALQNDRVKIIDIHNFGWSSIPDIQKTFAADNFHPNDLGYKTWYNAFIDKIHKDF